MAESNSLILLPPRHTAQATREASSSRPAKPAKAKGAVFGHRLEKAKAQKAAAAPQKQAVARLPVKLSADKPVKSVKEQNSQAKGIQATSKTLAQTKKQTEEQAQEDLNVDEPAKEHDVSQAHALEPQQPVAKKAAKPRKTEAGQSGDEANAPVQATLLSNGVTSISGSGAEDPGDQGGADGFGDGPDDLFTGKATAEFGTGKIAAALGKDSSAGTAAREATSEQSNEAAAVANADATADPLAEIAAPATVTSKAVSHGDASVESVVPGVGGLTLNSSNAGPATVTGKLPVPAATPQARFVEQNHPGIISGIAGQLLPKGGSIQLRLDPPELGALSVTVHLRDGVMTASFETSNDDATRLLSHSLGQLKSGLEAAGVSVDKIHVEQAPKRDMQGDTGGDTKQPPPDQQRQAQQDQQRRELIRQMWKKLAGGDPLDLVA